MNDRLLHRRILRRRLPDGLILLSGGTEVPRNNDVSYVFRQRSDFLYLAGVPEPGHHLLLDPKRGQDTLFVPRVDAEHRVWLGEVPGPAEARRLYGFSRARYADELPRELERARRGYRVCYAGAAEAAAYRSSLRGLRPHPAELEDALQELRAVKTPGELESLREASRVSGEAHRKVMAAAHPDMREYELQALFESHCLSRGLKHQAYPPIVAAGTNGAVLHYGRNDSSLRKGELLIIDAGAEHEGYAADITRTFPIGGRFTRRQRDVYSIVLETQRQCIERARPGILSGDLHLHAMRVIAEGLRSLGLLRGSTDDLVFQGAVRLFFPHGLGHMLGLDVHDGMGGKKRHVPPPQSGVRIRFNARLEPGFVITVEPGIYFNPALINDREKRSKLKDWVDFGKADGFLDFGGVRIEDNVVVRARGPALNLTDVPKEIDAVEAACAG